MTSIPCSRMARAASVSAMVLEGRRAATAGLSVASTAAAVGASLEAAAAAMCWRGLMAIAARLVLQSPA
jgi:hypothetical protein